MPRALRKPCPMAGCPELVEAGTRYCAGHASDNEQQRGTRQQRGYGKRHTDEIKKWAPLVATGTVQCVRCGRLILPEQKWSPDHNKDRTGYLGPAHRRCNLRAAGKDVKHRGNAGR